MQTSNFRHEKFQRSAFKKKKTTTSKLSFKNKLSQEEMNTYAHTKDSWNLRKN